MPDLSPLFIFVHQPKNAGNTFNLHLKHNLKPQERLLLAQQKFGLDKHFPVGLEVGLAKFLQSQQAELARRDTQLKIVYGHLAHARTAQFLDRYLPTKRPKFFFTFFREPAKRVVSFYNFYSDWYWTGNESERAKAFYQKLLLVDGQYPDFPTWYEQVFKPHQQYHSLATSVELFQLLGFLPQGQLSDEQVVKSLDQFNFVGLTETFAKDSAYLYFLLGFRKFFYRQNVSRKFYQLADHPEMYKQLQAELQQPYLLYEAAKKHRQKYLQTHPAYFSAVEEIKRRQKFRPLTQLIYDWPENARLVSKFLRQHLPGYSWLKDQIGQLPVHD